VYRKRVSWKKGDMGLDNRILDGQLSVKKMKGKKGLATGDRACLLGVIFFFVQDDPTRSRKEGRGCEMKIDACSRTSGHMDRYIKGHTAKQPGWSLPDGQADCVSECVRGEGERERRRAGEGRGKEPILCFLQVMRSNTKANNSKRNFGGPAGCSILYPSVAFVCILLFVCDKEPPPFICFFLF